MAGKMSPVVVADYETAAMVLASKISKHLSRLMRPSAKGVMLGLFSTFAVRPHLTNKCYRSTALLLSCLRLEQYLSSSRYMLAGFPTQVEVIDGASTTPRTTQRSTRAIHLHA